LDGPGTGGVGAVTVKDRDGRLIGSSDLTVTDLGYPLGFSELVRNCKWTFAVDVDDAAFYVVKIGTYDPVTLSAEKMASLHWRLNYDSNGLT
jgi:hypothetical protein